MADQQSTEPDHSLKATIGLDFTTATENAAEFAKEIDTIAAAFDKISTKARSINNTTGKKMQEILNHIETAQDLEVTDVDGVRQKIEQAIVRSIVDGSVTIKGLDNDFDITLDEKDIQAVQKAITDKLRHAVNKGKFATFEMGTFQLGSRVIESLKGRFEKELRTSIQNTLNFDFKDIDGNAMKFKMDIKADHMQGMLDGVRDRLFQHLSDPATFNIQSGWENEKIHISNDELRAVYEQLAAKMQVLAEGIKIDQAPFDRILATDLNAADFSKKLNDFVKQMELVQVALGNIKLTASEKDMQAFLDNVKVMKGSLVKSLETFLADVIKKLGKAENPQVADMKTQLTNIRSTIDAAVGAMFNGTIESILNQMGLMRMDIDGKEVLVPVIKKLEQVLLQAAKQVTSGIDDPAYAVDLKEAQNAIDKWSTSLGKALTAQINAQLKVLTAKWTGSNKSLLDNYAAGVAKLAEHAVFKPEENAQAITLNVPYEDLKAKLLPELQRAVNMLSQGIEFKRNEGEITGFSIPTDVVDKALADIRETILRQATTMAAALRDKSGASITEADTAYLERTMHTEARTLLEAIMSQARAMVHHFTDSVKSEALAGLDNSQVSQIHADLQSSMTTIISEFTGVLRSIVGSFTFASSAFKSIQETAASAVAQLEGKNTEYLPTHDLDQIAERLMDKAHTAVMGAIFDWLPLVEVPDIKIGAAELSPIVTAIKDGIEKALKQSAIGITTYLEQSLAGLHGGGTPADRSPDFTNFKKFIAKGEGFRDIPVERYTDMDALLKELNAKFKKFYPNAKGKVKKSSFEDSMGFVFGNGEDDNDLMSRVHFTNRHWEDKAGNTLKPTEQRIKETLFHELGHLLENKFAMEHLGGEPVLDTHSVPESFRKEWEKASRVMRPKSWDYIDNSDKYNWAPGEFEKHNNYLNMHSELFADAHSLVANRPDEAKKLMPNTFDKINQLVKKWTFIDPDKPETVGGGLDLSMLDDIPKALQAYVKRAVDAVISYINTKDIDESKFKKSVDAIDTILNLRIERILQSVQYLDAGGHDYSNQFHELNAAVNQKIIAALSSLQGMNEMNFDFSQVVYELNRVVMDRIDRLVTQIRMAESADGGPELNVASFVAELDAEISRLAVGRLRHMSETLRNIDAKGGDFSVKVSDLDKEVVKLLAEKMQIAVSELRKMKVVTGEQALANVAEANIQAVFNKFHQVINSQATKIVDQYKVALDAIPMEADLSSVPYLIKKFDEIQGDITSKVKELLDMQFHALAAAIKGIQANPMSIAAPAVPKGKAAVPVPVPAGRVSVGAGSSSGSRTQSRPGNGSGYVFAPYNNLDQTSSNQNYGNQGGDTSTFAGSVRNTMRYILAGSLMGLPSMMMYSGWDATKEFDYQMSKAKVNVDAKNITTPGAVSNYNDKEIRKYVLDMAIANSVDVKDASKAYQAATMKFDNPYEALTVARSATKMKAIEGDIDVEKATKGLTAMSAQWHLNSKDLEEVSNMMIMAANLKFTKVSDLLDMQQRAGSVFADALPGMDKRSQLATSIGLSAMFSQTTGKSGEQGGTFWKNALMTPLMGPSLKYFEDVSQSNDPKLQALNPYTKHTNAQGEIVSEQKNGFDMMLSLADAMNSNLDAKKKNEMLKMWANQWHVGDMNALISGFMEDSQKLGTNSTISQFGGVKDFFRTLGVTFTGETPKTPEEQKTQSEELAKAVALMNATMQDTYTFRTQKLKTEWQAASVDIFDSLKSEFSGVASQLSSLLRLIRQNADGIAQVVSIAGKAATALGIRYVAQWGMKKYKDSEENGRQKNLAYNFDRVRASLNEEGRYANLNRVITMDHRADLQSQLDRVNRVKNRIDAEGSKASLPQIHAEIKAKTLKQQELEANGKSGSAEHLKVIDELTDLDLHKNTLETNVKRGQRFGSGLDKEAADLEKQLAEVDRKFKQVDRSAMSVNNRMDLLDQSAKDYRLEMGRLTTTMHRVDLSQQGLSASSLGLKTRLEMIGREAGLDGTKISVLVSAVDKLGKEFMDGQHSADQFLKKLKELERQYQLNNTMVLKNSNGQTASAFNSKGAKPAAAAEQALFGGDIVNAVVGYGAFKGLTGLVGRKGLGPGGELDPMQMPAKRNAFMRTLDVAKGGFGLKTAINTVKDVGLGGATAAAVKGAGSGIGKGLLGGLSMLKGAGGGLLKVGLKSLKGVPFLGTALAGYDIFNDGISSIWRTKDENKLQHAENQKTVAQTANWGANHGWWGKSLASLGLGVNGITDSLIAMAGGSSANLGDYKTAISNMWDGTKGDKNGDHLMSLQNEMGYSKTAAQAKMDIERAALKDQEAKDLSTAGLNGRDDKVDWSRVSTYEEGKQMIDKIKTDSTQKLDAVNSKAQLEMANNTIRGIAKDSSTMRGLMIKFYDENIKVLEDAIAAAEERKKKVAPGSEAARAVDEEINLLKMQVADSTVKKYEENNAKVNTEMGNLDYSNSMTDSKYSILKSKAILGGAADNSAQIQALDRNMYLEQNQHIASTRSILAQYLEEYKGNEEMTKEIQKNIASIDQKSLENLVAIKKAVAGTKETFNLPAGVVGMTYWEQQVKDGTHKNISVGNGDSNVTILIDKMSGSEADLQRMGQMVTDVIRKDQANSVSNILAGQVRSGFQNNHRGN